MTRGPKPASAAVKSQKSAVRSTRTPPAPAPEITSSVGGVRPPSWLTGPGLDQWKRLAPTLIAAKLLSEADALAFGRYCRNFALWLKCRKEMDTEGVTYESESNHGKLRRAHPALLISDRIERQLLAMEDRFGLNPAERQRIFAARAQGVVDPLFAGFDREQRRADDPATKPAQPAQPIAGPIGLLN
jgi:P27 family predicted phage terminase small subunit